MRRFVAIGLALSLLVLLASVLAMEAELEVGVDAEEIHPILGAVMVVFALWHIVLNAKPLGRHLGLRKKPGS